MMNPGMIVSRTNESKEKGTYGPIVKSLVCHCDLGDAIGTRSYHFFVDFI